MTTLTNANGDLVDLTTGEIMGRAEGAPPVPTDPRKNTGAPDQAVDSPIMGLVNNTSWGFNAALFALPDAAVKEIGRQMRMKPEEITTLTKIFNSGEVAPRTSAERYARAIGEGLGGTAPLTGTLAFAARARPMVMAAQPSAGIIKGIANDAIQMVQKSPMKAATMDVVFSTGYEGMKQAIEENVDDSNRYKPFLKEILPAAAFVGLPLAAATLSPTALAMRGGKALQQKLTSNLGPVGEEVLAQETGLFKLPPFKIVPSYLIGRAEKKLSSMFGDIQKNPEALKSLDELKAVMADPRVEKYGFQFGMAERFEDPAMMQKQLETMQSMSPAELVPFRKQIADNQAKEAQLFADFAPDARKPLVEAFRAAQQDRQALFDDLLSQRQNLTDSERELIKQRFGPQNPDRMNDEVRAIIESGMEMDNNMRQGILKKMGLKQAISPDGTLASTRDPKTNASLFTSNDVEDAALSLLEKYSPTRLGGKAKLPSALWELDSFVRKQLQARTTMEQQMITQLADQAVETQLASMGRTNIDPEFIKTAKNSARELVGSPLEKVAKGKSGKGYLGMSDLAQGAAKNVKLSADGTASVFVTPGTSVYINPAQIKQDAQRIAKANTAIDLNTPEAIDLLNSAQRFRTNSLNNYNAAMMKGSRTRQTDAQRILDTGDAVFRDVEKLILDHSPKVKQEYDGMKMLLDDYKAGYENSLPLLMTQKTRGGQEYYLPNEDLMATAFKNADRVRQLQVTIGNNAQGKALLEKGAVDWLRNKPIFNNDGLIDANKLRKVMDQNLNIIEALPASVRLKIQDEVALADDVARRLAELDNRRIQIKDAELDALLGKAAKADADPRQTLEKAIKDPSIMRTLTNEMAKDPENLAALRRAVYDVATEGATKGGALEGFLRNNEKSMKVLFGGTDHYDDMLKLANLQRRINAFSEVTGQVPLFQTADQQLQNLFGISVPYLTTSIRNVAMRNVSKETMMVTLGTRLVNAKEQKVFQRMFTKALEDPKFADKMANLNTPSAAAAIAKQLQTFGVSPRRLTDILTLPAARDAAAIEISELPEEVKGLYNGLFPQEAAKNAAPVSRGTAGPTAAQMLKAQPAAPATRGTNFNPRMPTAPAVQPGAQQMPLMYPAMFPNDPISGLLQARQAGLAPR